MSLSALGWSGSGGLLAIAVAGALLMAYAVAEVVARLVRVAFIAGAGDTPELVDFRSPVVRRPIRVIRAVVFLIAALALSLPAARAVGWNPGWGLTPSALGAWVFGSGLRIALIAVLAYGLLRGLDVFARHLERELARGAGVSALERTKRARTLSAMLQNVLTVIIVGVALLMVLNEFRVDITPILTGAGILGLAVGFGAQTLVRDVLSGFFIILENQVRVGDVAEINGTGGLVEAINLRTIVLRDLEGVVHVFPNGGIARLANRTRDYSYYVVDVPVAYKEDTDAVVEVLQSVGSDLAADPAVGAGILAPLEILGVDGFGDSQVLIKIRIQTLPLRQWEVGRELRRRIKKAFDAQEIEMPFPHLSVYLRGSGGGAVDSLRAKTTGPDR